MLSLAYLSHVNTSRCCLNTSTVLLKYQHIISRYGLIIDGMITDGGIYSYGGVLVCSRLVTYLANSSRICFSTLPTSAPAEDPAERVLTRLEQPKRPPHSRSRWLADVAVTGNTFRRHSRHGPVCTATLNQGIGF